MIVTFWEKEHNQKIYKVIIYKNLMKVEIGKTYLTGIPHEGNEITFQHPTFRGTYGNVAEQIDNDGLKRPNSEETASLVYDAFQNSKGEYESEIIKILKDRWFWEFTGNLYLPKSTEEISDGVILETNPKIVDGKLNMDKKSLIKRLQKNDPLVNFVPFGYKLGEQTEFELMKNPYIVARYGEEGAQKIVEIASKYQKNSKLWSFDSVNEEKIRMSTLYCDWYSGGLDVVGDNWYDYDDGCAQKK